MTYTVTSKSLVISVGNKVIREEAMVDSHTPDTPAACRAAADDNSDDAVAPPLPAEVGGS
jgi:hypothetical protein